MCTSYREIGTKAVIVAQSVVYRLSLPLFLMPDMDSLTEVTGIDIKVFVTEVSGETAGMMERTEDTHFLPARMRRST
jgi:hypothetical protein